MDYRIGGERNVRVAKVTLSFVCYFLSILFPRRTHPSTDLAERAIEIPLLVILYHGRRPRVAVLVGKPSHKLLKEKEINVYRSQLLYREVERQFRRAAPQVEIALVGEHMPEEDFRRTPQTRGGR